MVVLHSGEIVMLPIASLASLRLLRLSRQTPHAIDATRNRRDDAAAIDANRKIAATMPSLVVKQISGKAWGSEHRRIFPSCVRLSPFPNKRRIYGFRNTTCLKTLAVQGFQPSFAQWAGNCELTTDVRNTFPGSVKLRAGSGALRAPYSGQSFGGLGDVV